MAAVYDEKFWWRLLQNLDVFKNIRAENKEKQHQDSLRIITVDGCLLFVWSAKYLCLLCTNFNTLLSSKQSSIDSANSNTSDVSDSLHDSGFQYLVCTTVPNFEVTTISLNRTGHLVALSGINGVSILELPRRWGKRGEFEGGKQKVICRTKPIGERLFLSSSKEKLLQASWHPGSETDTHLLLLTSDNYLRFKFEEPPFFVARDECRYEYIHEVTKDQQPKTLSVPHSLSLAPKSQNMTISTAMHPLNFSRKTLYNFTRPDVPEHVYSLGDISQPLSASGSFTASTSFALGEAAVAFDFGPVVNEENAAKQWPVYILFGNGDVYCQQTSLQEIKRVSSAKRLQGPLTMYPAAEDNYGVDACSIICLHSVPPVLVIATCTGDLYHCVLLDADDASSPEESSFTNDGASAADSMIYVYEKVELELSLTTPSLDLSEIVEDVFTCSILLHKDPGTIGRYFCTHNAGVHCVALPWIHNLQHVAKPDAESAAAIGRLDQECIVEHLICTKPLQTSPPSPILGLSVVTDVSLGYTLLCLTSAYECEILPLSLRGFLAAALMHVQYQRCIDASSSEMDKLLKNSYGLTVHVTSEQPLLSASDNEKQESPLRQMRSKSFDEHIRKMLEKRTTNPILRGAEQPDMKPSEYFRLLSRTTQVLREEHVLKHKQVVAEIEQRVKAQRELEAQQIRDMDDIQRKKQEIEEQAGRLAERYEDIKDNMDNYIIHAERILQKLQSRIPVLSDSEKEMSKELKVIEKKLEQFRTSLDQLRKKQQYQQRNVDEKNNQEEERVTLTKDQVGKLHSVLSNEGEEITNLIQRIKDLQSNLNL